MSATRRNQVTGLLCVALWATVRPALGQTTTWTNVNAGTVVTGLWSQAANWDYGIPSNTPTLKVTAMLTNTVNSYVVEVNDAPPRFEVLTLTNAVALGRKTTLNVRSNMDFGGGGFTNNMRRGSEINVYAGGQIRIFITGTTLGDFVLHDGGTLHARGTTGTRGYGGRMTVKSGGTWYVADSLQLNPGSVSVIEPGGLMSITAGTIYMPYNVGSFTAATIVTNQGTVHWNSAGASCRLGVNGGDVGWHEIIQVAGRFTMVNANSLMWIGVSDSTQHSGGRFTVNGGSVTNNGHMRVGELVIEHANPRRVRGEIVINGGFWGHFRSDRRILIGGFTGDNAAHATLRTAHYNDVQGSIRLTDGQFMSRSDIWVANGPSQGRVEVSGGTFVVTNAAGAATLKVGAMEGSVTLAGKGSLSLTGGTTILDRLAAVHGAEYSAVRFDGGTLEVKQAAVTNGAEFVVGNGTNTAALGLMDGPHGFADGLALSSNATLAVLGAGATGSADVAGDVTFHDGSMLHVDLAGPADHDVLAVDGSVMLGGTLNMTLLGGYDPPRGQTWTIVTTTSGAHGAFDAVPAGYKVGIAGNDVVLEHARIGTVMMVK